MEERVSRWQRNDQQHKKRTGVRQQQAPQLEGIHEEDNQAARDTHSRRRCYISPLWRLSRAPIRFPSVPMIDGETGQSMERND